MKFKTIVIILVLLIVYVIAKGVVTGELTHDYSKELADLNAKPTPTKTVKTPIVFTQEQLDEYYQTTKNPFVLHLRKALNGYLNGTNIGVESPNLVIKEDTVKGSPTGLDSFDKSYYKSKFIVYSIDDSVAGGKEIRIIFQDKPDKMFIGWVYKLATGKYDFRGFGQDTTYTEEKMKDIQTEYKTILEDKIHSV